MKPSPNVKVEAREQPRPVALKSVDFAYKGIHDTRTVVLSGADLDVKSGEIVAIIGESGVGKTTLLNLIAGLVQPDSGTVKRGSGDISYLQQDDHLLPYRTAYQNACLAAELRDSLTPRSLSDCKHLLGDMHLAAAVDKFPDSLSGGMRRRIALARQLLPATGLFLLDEPFSSQDRGIKQSLEDLVFARCRKAGAAAVIVTHDLDTAAAIGDRTMVLDASKKLIEAWRCPDALKEVAPSARREMPEFAENVAELWRKGWTQTHG
jgi:ABC-type nitrate/sulfonate/bicarbonate transport system ATPase subunit